MTAIKVALFSAVVSEISLPLDGLLTGPVRVDQASSRRCSAHINGIPFSIVGKRWQTACGLCGAAWFPNISSPANQACDTPICRNFRRPIQEGWHQFPEAEVPHLKLGSAVDGFKGLPPADIHCFKFPSYRKFKHVKIQQEKVTRRQAL